MVNKKTVFVGMSGGVDSSVSAALLQQQGYTVVGVFIKTWHPDFIKCNEEEERRDAMRVATYLDIPFLTFDFEDVYKKEVADYMIAEYKGGRTPNPDVMCNKHVKFGAFLKKALEMGADYVATGHYAKNKKKMLSRSSNSNLGAVNQSNRAYRAESTSFYSLEKANDPSKDQAYFLWTLKQVQLSKILFPVGHLNKTEVRKLALKFKLPTAEKKDSQGICFLGAVDLKDFLKHYIKEKKGRVLNERGEEIGFHNGAVFHTLGERHGFTITKKNPNDGAYYVVGKDVKKNILYVSQNISPCQGEVSKGRRGLGEVILGLKDTNWISEIPKENKNYTAQIRYHGEFLLCKIKCSKSNFEQKRVKVIFKKPILVALGQSVVLYDKEICLGGGVVA